jgi:ABC-type branched-subunit amino acid transport system substrate-binding protein
VLAVGRTYPSDAVYTQMMLRVISAYGWENIAILHGNDEYANSFALGMQTNTAAAGVSVVTAISYEINDRSTYGPACASLEASGVNIIGVAAYGPALAQILNACRAAGQNDVDLLAPGYV